MCDLYAGIGSVGIEALSRGAEKVTFIDNSPVALSILRSNLDRAREQEAIVIDADAHEFLQSTTASFDVVMADPPYGSVTWEQLQEDCASILKKGGLFVMEMDIKATLPVGLDVREYGKSKLAIWRHA